MLNVASNLLLPVVFHILIAKSCISNIGSDYVIEFNKYFTLIMNQNVLDFNEPMSHINK